MPAFTILSCDNLPGNGDVARSTITGLAQLSDPDLARWISENARFPNSMVDGITPATTDRERAIVSEAFGIEDAAPVVCESFRQWVIEDSFSAGRPPLEQVGVEFVTDVSRYELMKLRILNAGHAAIAYAAGLLGYHFVHTAMADEDIRDWLRALQLRESIPTLPPLPGVDYARYLETVITRFSNPKIGDTIPRLAAEGSNRQPKFILPTLRDALAKGAGIDGLALEVALWCVYCRGHTEAGTDIDLQDSLAHELREKALASVKRPAAFLEISSVFGDLADTPRFATAFAQSVSRLQTDGVRETLRNYVSRQ